MLTPHQEHGAADAQAYAGGSSRTIEHLHVPGGQRLPFWPRRAAADDDENSFLVVRQAATRFGWVSFSVDKQTDDKGTVPVASIEGSSLHIEANVSLVLHGRGFVGTGDCLRVVVRLRDPAGERSLKSASITGSIGGRVTIAEVDSAG